MALPGSRVEGYRYCQLKKEKRTIRLLTFADSNSKGHHDDDDDDVHLTIHEYDLTSGCIPEYIALSYTWGTFRRNVPIVVNGVHLKVTASLSDALKHLKNIEQQRGDFPGYWWIDMICINKDDDNERGHQVGMMRDIFKGAGAVVALLGGTSCDEKAEKFLQKLREDSPYNNPRVESEYSEDMYDGCWALLDHPWWSRFWIIQEVILAREVIVACGDTTIPWATLRHFIMILEASRRFTVIPEASRRVLPREMALNLAMLKDGHKDIELREGSSKYDRCLGWLLTITADICECTDPRDKVYALLGLAGNHGIIPDYALSPCAVYCSAIRAIARVWHGYDMRRITQSFPHVSLEKDDVVLENDCDGDQCGTWRCLLDIAQFDFETESKYMRAKDSRNTAEFYGETENMFWRADDTCRTMDLNPVLSKHAKSDIMNRNSDREQYEPWSPLRPRTLRDAQRIIDLVNSIDLMFVEFKSQRHHRHHSDVVPLDWGDISCPASSRPLHPASLGEYLQQTETVSVF